MIRPQITSRRRRLVAAAAATALLLIVAPAQAQGEQPGVSAVSQYVEAVPTGTGSSPPGATTEARPVRGDGAQRVTRTLERIAESSSYGAPRHTDAAASRMPDAQATTSVSASLRSTLGALGTTSDARLFVLLAVVLVTTVVAIGLATRHTRS